jgi:ABC-type transporter Mla MlaB component
MLRITTHDQGNGVTLELEGRLAGPWVAVLRDCWERLLASPSEQAVRIDCRAVTFVDSGGKALLAEMSSHYAQFHAADCLMKAILAEISPANKPA